MKARQPATLLRIYTKEQAKIGERSLYEVVIQKARESGLAGATVLRGPVGFGAAHQAHTDNIHLSGNAPLVIEIVDEEVRLRIFVAAFGDAWDIGLITLEKVEVLHYGHGLKR